MAANHSASFTQSVGLAETILRMMNGASCVDDMKISLNEMLNLLSYIYIWQTTTANEGAETPIPRRKKASYESDAEDETPFMQGMIAHI